jgi:histidyl-tRNA synthetase
MEKISAPRGTKDVLPKDSYKWQYVEKVLKGICENFNFKEIRTPTFEHTELFLRGVGDTSDVVSKEMYTFCDKGDRSITLRPEGTAGVARSFIENGLFGQALPLKLFYMISCFRYEKPQAGRLREFHQFGIEILGTTSPISDAESIILGTEIFRRLKIGNISLSLNNIGCKACRVDYNKKLMQFLNEKKDSLCATCSERMAKNPMRVFDCKSPVCAEIVKDAPTIFDNVCDECNNHFYGVTAILDHSNIAYTIDKSIVRGLDYYSKTVFEFVSTNIGAQGTVLGGGRYDGLIAELGGNDAPGVGFAMGIERLLLLLEHSKIDFPNEKTPDIFIIPMGENAYKIAYKFVFDLRKKGISAECDLNNRSLKAQMKYADKIGAKHTLIIGDDEINTNQYKLKNMETGEIIETNLEDLIENGETIWQKA